MLFPKPSPGLFTLILVGLLALNQPASFSITPETDSLLQIMAKPGLEINKRIEVLNALSSSLLLTDLGKSKEYALSAFSLISKCDNCEVRGKIYLNLAYTHMLSDSGLIFSREAIKEFESSANEKDLGIAYNRYAKLLSYHGKYDECLTALLKAKDIFQKLDCKQGIADVNCDLAVLYKELYNFEKSYDYAVSALNEYQKLNDKKGIADAKSFISDYYFHKNDTANIFLTVHEQVLLYKELGNTAWYAYSLSNLGDAYIDYSTDYKKAIDYLNLSKAIAEEANRTDILINTLRKLSRAWLKNDNVDSSKYYLNLATNITESNNLTSQMYNDLMYIYIYMQSGENERAMESFNSYREKLEKLHSDELNEKISQMEVAFETQQKENQIIVLEKKKKISLLYIVGLIILLVIVMITSLIIIRQIRLRRIITEQEVKIREQQLIEMKKERQLLATSAVLEGEESERKRLARDLHDGLGGLLTGLKFSLLNVKGNYISSERSASEFDYALGLLDNSMQELRRVAQNMMPESLLKLGIKEALNDFCITISKNTGLAINYQYYGKTDRLPAKFETSLYRIAQELINNAVKHSEATDIFIQVIQEENRLHLTVQDNGKGFEQSQNSGKNGIGLANIKSRVAAVNGQIDIISAKEKGTEVLIELPII
jgi:two-component system, NarL family, sensor kinase